MHHVPKRARTAKAGACSHCIHQRERCYIGVQGIPCSNCRRLNLPCDANVSVQFKPEKRRPSLTYCTEAIFASHIRRTEQEQSARKTLIPAVPAADPLENYISIAHQLLGPPSPSPSISINVPNYVSGLPNRLEPGDLEYLEKKGALCLPTVRFRTELLKSYILWVHPQVPVLDLDVFLRIIAENDGSNSISLLLFHAVTFVASAFVDISHIHNEGYTSRKEARSTFFRRVKALLELDCEDDRLVTIQTLLLLVHWNDLPDAEKDASHWMGICLSLAMSIGLHRNPNSAALTPSQRQAWRRTWWSVYNHARLTSEDLLSMMHIQESCEDSHLFDTTMITLNDFQFGVFSPEARAVVDDCDVLRTIEYQKTQALVFIEKSRLCQLSQFSRLSNQVRDLVCGTSRSDRSNGNAPQQDETEGLHRWLLELPSAVRHQYPLVLTPTEWERSIYLHRAWLQLLYLGLEYATCCDESRTAGDISTNPAICHRPERTSQYLLGITDIFDEIDSLGLSEHLPSPSTALLILVLTYHRRPLDTGTPRAQATSARTLRKCWNMIHKLEETSELAGRMISVVRDDMCIDVWEWLSSGLLLV